MAEEPSRLSIVVRVNGVVASQFTSRYNVPLFRAVGWSGFKSFTVTLPWSTMPPPDRLGVQALGVIRPVTRRSALLAAKATGAQAITRGVNRAREHLSMMGRPLSERAAPCTRCCPLTREGYRYLIWSVAEPSSVTSSVRVRLLVGAMPVRT